MVTGCRVKTPVTAGDFAFEQLAVKDVAGDALEFLAGQPAFFRAGTEQRLDAMPARGEFVDEVRADEAGRAGDKTFHDASTGGVTDMPTGSEIPPNYFWLHLNNKNDNKNIAI